MTILPARAGRGILIMELFKILPVKVVIESTERKAEQMTDPTKLTAVLANLQRLANYAEEIKKSFSSKKVEKPQEARGLRDEIRITVNIKDFGWIYDGGEIRAYTKFFTTYSSSKGSVSMLLFYRDVDIKHISTHYNIKHTLSEFDDWIKKIIKSSVEANQSNRQES